MKNNYLKLIGILAIAAIYACNQGNAGKTSQNDDVNFPKLKDRNDILAKSGDWSIVKAKAEDLWNKVDADSTDFKSRLLLAQLYMQEARITGEHPYYYPATLMILDDILKKDKQNFEALAFKSSVLLSLHHFSEALEVGTRAAQINSNNGFIYGVLCDAHVELGHYDEAVKMSDKMQNIRPGLESYSRASYLREIYGDNNGAIEAMKLAYQAGLPGSEEASWAGNTLSHLLENTGDLKHAEEISTIVLEQRPSYAFATDALGRIELAKGNYDKAIALFDEAIKTMPEFSFYENKAEALEAKGENDKAKQIYKDVIVMLDEDAKSGHYTDLELAKVYIKLGDFDKAAKYASIEYKRRPENIDVNESMAWILYKKGNYAEAKRHMDVAMRMGTQNAEMMAKAGMIEIASGNKATGESWVKKAQQINPYISAELTGKAKNPTIS